MSVDPVTGNINVGGKKITGLNLALPTNNSDAASKLYVDQVAAAGGGGGGDSLITWGQCHDTANGCAKGVGAPPCPNAYTPHPGYGPFVFWYNRSGYTNENLPGNDTVLDSLPICETGNLGGPVGIGFQGNQGGPGPYSYGPALSYSATWGPIVNGPNGSFPVTANTCNICVK